MGTAGSYNSTQPLKHLNMSHHDIWLTTTSGKKSEAKEVAAKMESLAKLVSFNTTDETEVKIVGTKNKKQPVQTQMTMMKSSSGGTSCLLNDERATISVALWFVYSTSSVRLVTLDNPYFLNMLEEKVPVRYRGSKHPKLTQLNAKKYLDSEYKMMTK